MLKLMGLIGNIDNFMIKNNFVFLNLWDIFKCREEKVLHVLVDKKVNTLAVYMNKMLIAY